MTRNEKLKFWGIVLASIASCNLLIVGAWIYAQRYRPDSAQTIAVLEADGYSQIELLESPTFPLISGCAQGDIFQTKWRAKKGDRSFVGYACSGIGKGTTIRVVNVQ